MSETPPTWEAIAQVGDIERWVVARLQQLGLLDDATDPAKLSGNALRQFKARREEERKVRKQLRQQAWAAYRKAHLVHLGADVFHHDTPDQDRYDLPDPEARRETNNLPAFKDVQGLAKALELTIPQLRWLAFHREVDTGSHYQYWTIPKRDGGQRLISSPKPILKKTQRWILRQMAERLPVHGAAHGFLPGRSIFTNAAIHAGARLLVKLDIRHFYPTVTWRRVKGLFRKGGYGEQVATVLALLCTEAPRELLELDGKPYHVASGPRALPQGAPTSPALSNTVCLRLDANAITLARCGIENGNVGLVDRHGFLNDAARRSLHGIGFDMLFDQIDAVHDKMGIILAQRDGAPLAFVAPCEHDDFVALANLIHRTVLRELQEPGTRSS